MDKLAKKGFEEGNQEEFIHQQRISSQTTQIFREGAQGYLLRRRGDLQL